ncbi:hypothetical protein N7535_009370 [Penicillium sp. DV-2018c]|nr:hypothetical protein N7535_009370 [Penicillium sp. DV-2018c]
MGGDFAQTLPIVVSLSRTRTVAACLQRSSIWPQLAVRQLHRNMHLPPSGVNADYARYISTMSYREEVQGTITLPPYIPQSETVEDLCNAVYPDTVLSAGTRDRTCLPSGRSSPSYFLADRAQDGPGRDQATLTELAPDYLRSLNMPGLPPSKLELKDSAPIMLIRSFRQEEQPHPFQRLSVASSFRSVSASP